MPVRFLPGSAQFQEDMQQGFALVPSARLPEVLDAIKNTGGFCSNPEALTGVLSFSGTPETFDSIRNLPFMNKEDVGPVMGVDAISPVRNPTVEEKAVGRRRQGTKATLAL